MSHSKIVPLFKLKIHCLVLITCCGVATSAPSDSSHSFVDGRADLKYPLQVSFKRIQTYRSFPLAVSGVANFSNDSTISIAYSKPLKYSVTYSDSATITTDKKKGHFRNRGYRDVVECDPFHLLMIYCYGQLQDIVCKGSFDSVMVYSASAGKRKYLLSLDRDSRRWREIAFVTSSGTVYERARFHYKNESVLPLSVVVETVTGKEIVRDSLLIGNVMGRSSL